MDNIIQIPQDAIVSIKESSDQSTTINGKLIIEEGKVKIVKN